MSMTVTYFKVLALSAAVTIIALTPLSSLIFWVEGSSEVVYSGLDYDITYKPSLLNLITKSNETRVRLEVRDASGRPLKFMALLSGPTSETVIEVGHVSGKGYAVKSIGRYVEEVRKALREANSDPERSGLGMLILISTIIEENGEKYAAADAVSIPIIPGKAVGKDIVVSVKFKPIMKYKIGESEEPENNKIALKEEAEPPEKIRKCTYEFRVGEMCSEWRLAEVLYTTQLRYIRPDLVVGWDYIPVAITELNNFIGSKTKEILHYLGITLRKADIAYVDFAMSMGWTRWGILTLYAPGSGYTIYIKRDLQFETIHESECKIYSTLNSESSSCKYRVSDTRWS
ncbi:MAG: hypothetical protein ACK4H7_00665, partial [Acidilobaceae archaeon]